MDHHYALTKIIDGLYVGDHATLQDEQTLLDNYITHVVLRNRLQGRIELRELVYAGDDEELVGFVEGALDEGECCVICGDVHWGLVLTVRYLMHRFRWSLFKGLEFINWRVPGAHLTNLDPLKQLELHMINKGHHITYNWDKYQGMSLEQLIITNTFRNSQTQQYNYQHIIKKHQKDQHKGKPVKRVRWNSLPKRASYSPVTKSGKKSLHQLMSQKEQIPKNAKQKIILSVMEVINQNKKPKSTLSKASKHNVSKARIPTIHELNTDYRSDNVRTEGNEGENFQTQPRVETQNIQPLATTQSLTLVNSKKRLVEATVRRLKQISQSEKITISGLKKSRESRSVRQKPLPTKIKNFNS